MADSVTSSVAATGSVGVVIRTKDRPCLLLRSLTSLAGQSYPNWRAVIVNDGGDPLPIREVVAAPACADYLAAGRIEIVDHPASVGRGRAFNAGLRALTTEFCCCLDDDDAWAPDFLSRMVAGYRQLDSRLPAMGAACGEVIDIEEVLTDPEAPFSLEKCRTFSVETGRRRDPIYNRAEHFILPMHYLFHGHNCLPVQLLFDRSKLLEFGGFSEIHEVLEDRAMLVRFLSKYRIGVVKGAVAYHYMRKALHVQHRYRNSMGNNETYDWQHHLKTIESDLLYDRSHGSRTAEIMFLLHDCFSYLIKQDVLGRSAVRASRRAILNYVKRNKGRIAVIAIAMALLQVGLAALGAFLAIRFFG
jgi:glycosyltransferase involved in cell wall biosynthesis